MKRRKALEITAAILGSTIVGAEMFLSGCTNDKKKEILFSQKDISFLDEVGETILPDTDQSPGAKAAHIGEFMKTIVQDCYTPEERAIFTDGMLTIQNKSEEEFSHSFIELTPKQRLSLLTGFDREATQSKDDGTHFFSMIKQLTIWGYFTSEPGATKALRYNPIPGRYDGCIPYNGEKAWA